LVPAKPEPIPGFAAVSAEAAYGLANQLRYMGLFAGTGQNEDGAPKFELERPLSRLESLAILLRLLGLESAASKSTAANPFRDVPAWGDRTAAYAYEIGLTVGINQEHTLYAPDRLISAKEFTAFLLRALGYRESANDFKFDQALDKAAAAELYKLVEPAKLKGTEFLRAEAVIAISDALLAYQKNSTLRLIDKLQADNVIEKDAASDFVAVYSKTKK
jgi:hypothetical protein